MNPCNLWYFAKNKDKLFVASCFYNYTGALRYKFNLFHNSTGVSIRSIAFSPLKFPKTPWIHSRPPEIYHYLVIFCFLIRVRSLRHSWIPEIETFYVEYIYKCLSLCSQAHIFPNDIFQGSVSGRRPQAPCPAALCQLSKDGGQHHFHNWQHGTKTGDSQQPFSTWSHESSGGALKVQRHSDPGQRHTVCVSTGLWLGCKGWGWYLLICTWHFLDRNSHLAESNVKFNNFFTCMVCNMILQSG